jgi:2-polyprenyl-6-methoxyphenol hydroxylase-like FAD-dependent oxidoreductase
MRYRDLAATLDAASIRTHGNSAPAHRLGITTAARPPRSGWPRRRTRTASGANSSSMPKALRPTRPTSACDYRQHAVVAEVRPVPAHAHRAWERFTPDGPLALLPLAQDYSVVFTVPPDKADATADLDEDLSRRPARQFGGRLDFVASGPRASFPLALRVRQQLSAPRQVWIGNAAQSLHPVSGQGFNLGLRDAWELAEALLANAGGDAGSCHPGQPTPAPAPRPQRQHGVYRRHRAPLFQRPGAAAARARAWPAGARSLAAAAPLRRPANDLGRPGLAVVRRRTGADLSAPCRACAIAPAGVCSLLRRFG